MPKTRTWSRLATSVLSGDSEIVLEGNDYPNWQVGEEIVIAPSGWNPEESEIRTIATYDDSTGRHRSELLHADTQHTHTHTTHTHTHTHTLNTCTPSPTHLDTITLDTPLQFDHTVHNFLNSSDISSAPESNRWWGDGGALAPEVGLLTHNIVIQGECSSDLLKLLRLHHKV